MDIKPFENKLWLAKPMMHGEEMKYVKEAYDTNWMSTVGENINEVERIAAEKAGVKYAVGLSSCTAALHLAIKHAGERLYGKPAISHGALEGKRVFCSDMTFVATLNPVVYEDGVPVFIETDAESWNMDPVALEKAFEIYPDVKLVVSAELYGFPGRMDLIKKICAKHGALTWRTIPGVSNEDIYKKLQLLSPHGRSKDTLAKTKLGAWEYDIVGTYYKCNMTDVAAVIGLKQFERYPDMLSRRKKIIGKYDAALKPLGVETLDHYNDSHGSSGHLYITRVLNITLEQRNEIIIKMAESGVACNVHYKPLPMHTAYKNLGFDIVDYPNAYAHFANEITLPPHTCLTDEDVEYVIAAYKKVLGEYIK